MDPVGYPWSKVVQGQDLAQGDLFERCPVFLPPADMAEPWDEAASSRFNGGRTQRCRFITLRRIFSFRRTTPTLAALGTH